MTVKILAAFLSGLIFVATGAFAFDLTDKQEAWANQRLWQPMTAQRKEALNKVLNFAKPEKLEFLRKRVELFCETSAQWLERSKQNSKTQDADKDVPRGDFVRDSMWILDPFSKFADLCEVIRAPEIWGKSGSYAEYLSNSKRALLGAKLEAGDAKSYEYNLQYVLIVAFFLPTQIKAMKPDELKNIDEIVKAKFDAKPKGTSAETANCEPPKIAKDKYEEYMRDPTYGPVAMAFVAQSRKLANDQSVLGDSFKAYDPDPSVGYSPLYATNPENDLIVDATQRPLIKAATVDASREEDVFAKLYALEQDDTWHPERANRVTGFAFAGYKVAPEKIKSRCGLWADLLSVDRDHEPLRKFETYYEAKKGRLKIDSSEPHFSVPKYAFWTTGSIFLSTTRSVFVARRFATSAGARREAAQEAWVYVILVHNGFDHRDRNVIRNPETSMFRGEQEITVRGMEPWSDIVGYRKMLREPKKGAPPEFVGPIYLREQLRSKEPRAFAEIVRTLSMKSKYTQDFDRGIPWRGKHD